MDIKEFIVGNTYTNADISDSFKVSLMRGMARSLKTNSLVLTSKHTSLSTTILMKINGLEIFFITQVKEKMEINLYKRGKTKRY